jgi:myo-inositol-1(or 4)-monophosphatase
LGRDALAAPAAAKVKNPDNIWILAPLDGTANFLHGLPRYCVSIALQHKGIVTQGVVQIRD